MRKLQTTGSIEKGILKIHKRNLFTENLKQFPDCRVLVTVEKQYKHRSTYTYNEETEKQGTGQNGYYWFIICQLFREGWQELTGELIDKNQAHERLKMYCNYKEIANETTGEIVKIPQSTATMTTVDAEEYYTRCRMWIFENMNIDVPMPNEKLELFQIEKHINE